MEDLQRESSPQPCPALSRLARAARQAASAYSSRAQAPRDSRFTRSSHAGLHIPLHLIVHCYSCCIDAPRDARNTSTTSVSTTAHSRGSRLLQAITRLKIVVFPSRPFTHFFGYVAVLPTLVNLELHLIPASACPRSFRSLAPTTDFTDLLLHLVCLRTCTILVTSPLFQT